MRKKRLGRLKEVGFVSRRVFGRRVKSTSKWWSDPTKLIPLFISTFALIISFLSWRESNRARLMNEEVNRPVLAFTHSTYLQLSKPKFTAYFYIKNIGKVAGLIDEIEVLPLFVPSQPGFTCSDKEQTSSINKTILPNLEERISFPITIPEGCGMFPNSPLSLIITLNYSDSITGRRHYQIFVQSLRDERVIDQKTTEDGNSNTKPN